MGSRRVLLWKQHALLKTNKMLSEATVGTSCGSAPFSSSTYNKSPLPIKLYTCQVVQTMSENSDTGVIYNYPVYVPSAGGRGHRIKDVWGGNTQPITDEEQQFALGIEQHMLRHTCLLFYYMFSATCVAELCSTVVPVSGPLILKIKIK